MILNCSVHSLSLHCDCPPLSRTSIATVPSSSFTEYTSSENPITEANSIKLLDTMITFWKRIYTKLSYFQHATLKNRRGVTLVYKARHKAGLNIDTKRGEEVKVI